MKVEAPKSGSPVQKAKRSSRSGAVAKTGEFAAELDRLSGVEGVQAADGGEAVNAVAGVEGILAAQSVSSDDTGADDYKERQRRARRGVEILERYAAACCWVRCPRNVLGSWPARCGKSVNVVLTRSFRGCWTRSSCVRKWNWPSSAADWLSAHRSVFSRYFNLRSVHFNKCNLNNVLCALAEHGRSPYIPAPSV